MAKQDKKSKGRQVRTAPTQYDFAETIEKVAKKLISKDHTHLINCKMAYLYVNKEITSKGRKVAATAERVSGKHTALSGYHFVITISYPIWRNLSDPTKIAVIDHELSHCWVEENETTGDTVYKTVPHDVEEFGAIIMRHGLYTGNLVKIGQVVGAAKVPDTVTKDVVVKKLGKPADNIDESDKDFDADEFADGADADDSEFLDLNVDDDEAGDEAGATA